MYLCNDQDVDVTIDLSTAVTFGNALELVCTQGGDNEDAWSGQMFFDDLGGYNLVFGFCDNNQPTDTPPSAYTYPGPNGDAFQCGK